MYSPIRQVKSSGSVPLESVHMQTIGGEILLDSGAILTFIIVSFAFSLVIIMKKDSMPTKVKRPLAILALAMIVLSFGLIVYSLFMML